MMIETLSVSIVVPVYNGACYLGAAIDSVLSQTLPLSEIIVVDDGCTDGSAAIAQSYAPLVRCLHQANRGPASARNSGASHATGDLLAFLDADDLWMPDKLVRQMQVLLRDPTCEAVLGRVENFISPELDDVQRHPLARAALQTGDVHVGALLIRRKAFSRIGWFDTRWRHGEFIEWWARAMRLNLTYAVLPDLVLRRRLHSTNLTRREKAGRRDYLPLLREQLAQRRVAAVRQNLTMPEDET